MKKIKSKNLIVIIGNGFDLSHNLMTRYSDFANHLIETVIPLELSKLLETRNLQNTFFNRYFVKEFVQKTSINDIGNPVDIVWSHTKTKNKEKLIEYFKNNIKQVSRIISNHFLAKLFSNKYNNWFDIENAYFKELIGFKRIALSEKDSFKKHNLIKLNLEFNYIKKELKKYLNTIKISKNIQIENFINSFINLKLIQNVYFINFNYTNTIEQYLINHINRKNIKINYIHGSLINDDIIFGYGNDQNPDYQQIKNTEINEFLEYFKTFEYLKNNQYSKIYEDSIDLYQDYEVLILGHSLGLSDKTLLEEILDSEKCKKIHLFKRTDLKDNQEKVLKSFNELIFSASRIISDEKKLRKRIWNYKDSIFFP